MVIDVCCHHHRYRHLGCGLHLGNGIERSEVLDG